MNLHVKPDEVDATGDGMAVDARDIAQKSSFGWFQAAGADTASGAAWRAHNSQLTAVYDQIGQHCNDYQETGHKAKIAAAAYRRTDALGATAIGLPGADLSTDPSAPQPISLVITPPTPPRSTFQVADNPRALARQLNGRPGVEPAQHLAERIRTYLTGPYLDHRDGMEAARSRYSEWTPTGDAAVGELDRHLRTWTNIGSTLDSIATSIDRYTHAFQTAATTHPKPDELEQAWNKLQAALRSRDELGAQKALAEYNELCNRSEAVAGKYFGEVGDATSSKDTPAGNKPQPNQSGGTSTAGAFNPSSMMNPLMFSSLADALSPSDDSRSDDEDYYDDGYGDDYLPNYESIGAGYSPGAAFGMPSVTGGGSTPTATIAHFPIAASTAAMTTATNVGPRAPVVDAYNPAIAATAGTARTGSPYPPYMPMAPGMGGLGANGNDRSRNEGLFPNRRVYDDDTPHTEPVIGEKRAIIPTVTAPTPATSPTGGTP